MNVDQVACCLVTRGDIDLNPVLESLPRFREVVVWDNSTRGSDLSVFGRYQAIRETTCPFIYTQDDDAVCPAQQIVEAYDGDGLLVNVPPAEKPWLAWGAVFPRGLPEQTFQLYRAEADGVLDDMVRWPDVIFAHLAGWQTVNLGHTDLPWATAPNRMYMQHDHYTSQAEVRERCERLRSPS